MCPPTNELQYLELTLAAVPCNLACLHCFSSDNQCGRLLSVEDIRQILDDLDALRFTAHIPAVHVALLDEPANHPHIVQIWQMLANRGYIGSTELLATNGTRIARDRSWQTLLCDLKRHGLKVVQLTLYGLASTHDWFAGKEGAFCDLLICAQRCLTAGIDVNWSFMLHLRNLAEFDEMRTLAAGIGGNVPEKGCGMIPTYAGRAKQYESLRPTWNDLERLHPDPDVVRGMSQVFRPESEWIRRGESGLLANERLLPEGMGCFVIDGNRDVYALQADPRFRLGRLDQGLAFSYAVLREAGFPGMVYRQPGSYAEIAQKFGDVTNERLHRFQSVWGKWMASAKLPA